MINSKQWKEFKEWRKSEREKIFKSEKYIFLTDKIKNESKEKPKKSKWNEFWDVASPEPSTIIILESSRKMLFYDIPNETLENCYIWLLENNKIN